MASPSVTLMICGPVSYQNAPFSGSGHSLVGRLTSAAMRPNDIETITGFLERRKQSRRVNVRGTYRDFQF